MTFDTRRLAEFILLRKDDYDETVPLIACIDSGNIAIPDFGPLPEQGDTLVRIYPDRTEELYEVLGLEHVRETADIPPHCRVKTKLAGTIYDRQTYHKAS